MTRGSVVHWKQDVDGNTMGISNQNPILDMCLYMVEFPGGKFIELAANVIAESMYAQCDVNGNKCLLLEAFINHKKVWMRE